MKGALEWLASVTGNYGVAIILLTLAVRVLILPLSIYQTKSMKRMQEVQPLMKEIQTKYKDNPEKMNQEMMNLYKTHGVNPFSGCLPLFIQMPFLYAVFVALRSYPELPGFLWIESLSSPDNLKILPILSVVFMLAQSYLGGTGTDQNQRFVMFLMPLFIGWISFNMPAGIVLYWVISTVFGLVQQAIYPGFPRLKGGSAAKGEAGA